MLFKLYLTFLGLVVLAQTSTAQQNDSLAQRLALQAKQFNNENSLPFLEEAFDLCRNGRCADTTLASLYQRKSVAYYRGYIDDNLAVNYSDTAKQLYERAYPQGHFLIANSYYNLGAMQGSLGKSKAAEANIKTALKILDDLPGASNDSVTITWNYQYVKALIELEDYPLAIHISKKTLQHIDASPNYQERVLNNLGRAYIYAADYDNALATFRTLQAAFPTTSSNFTNGNIGIIYLYQNKLTEAEVYLANAHAKHLENLQSEPSNKRYKVRLSNSHANLLQLNLQKQNWDAADRHYEEGLGILMEVDPKAKQPLFAEFYFKKAQLYYHQGQYENCLLYLSKALEVVAPQITNTTAGEINIIGPFKQGLEIIAFRARVNQAQGAFSSALEDIERLNRLITQNRRSNQSALSKYYLLRNVVPIYELGIQINHELYLKTQDPAYLQRAYTLNAQNKAVILLDNIQSDRAMTFGGLPIAIQEEEKNLSNMLLEKERLLYNLYQNGSPTDSMKAVVFEYEQVYNNFIEALENDYPAYYQLKHNNNASLTLSEIQDKLASGQAMIEYFTGQDSIYTFLIDKTTTTLFSQATPNGFIDSVRLFRELLSNGIEQDCEAQFIRLSRYFYKLLLADPLGIVDESCDRLIIIPDGSLNFLSFETLLYREVATLNGIDGFILEQYAFSYAYSSRLLLEEQFQHRTANKGFVGFGLEYDDHTLNYLKDLESTKIESVDTSLQLPCGLVDTTRYLGKLAYSDDEVKAIAKIMNGTSWLNEDVTKDVFLKNAADYRLLHLAMHGSYDLEFPMNSSLIFTLDDSSDVFLRAGEVYGLELAADMAVLSACNTAYGKLQIGEGPMTLARAFHYAGVPSVVASLWSIPDNSTSSIMQLFYQFLNEGMTKDVALQRAKIAYLKDSDLSSPATRMPVHWAPTIIIGGVNPIKNNFPWWWLLGGLVGAFALRKLFFRTKTA